MHFTTKQPRKTQWLAGMFVVLIVAGAFGYLFWWRADALVERIRNTSPENLKAYALKPEERDALAKCYALRQTGDSARMKQWADSCRCPLQRIGIFLAEQSMLLRARAQTDLAQAKLDTALTLGNLLLAAAQDSFLLQHVLFIKSLSFRDLPARVHISETFAVARELFIQQDYEKAGKWLQRTRVLAHEARENCFFIESSYLLQYALSKQSRYAEVIVLGYEIFRHTQNSKYRLRLAAALAEAADAYSHQGKKDSALVVLEDALAFATGIHDSVGLARCYFSQAQIQRQAGKYVEAEQSLAQVERFDNLGRYRGQIPNLQAQIAGMKCEYDRAEELYRDALANYQENFDLGNQIQTAVEISKIKTQSGDYQGALAWAQQACHLGRGTAEKERLSAALGQLGWVYVQMDSMPQAIRTLQEAAAITRKGSNVALANIKCTLGKAYLQQGAFEAARSTFMEVEKIAADDDFKILSVEARLGLGEVALSEDHAMQAQAWFSSAADLAQRTGEISLEIDALSGIAQTQRRLNERSKALRTLNHAFAVGETLRVSLRHDSSRVHYFSTLQDAFDQAVAIAWELGDPQLALHYAERGRARALRDAFIAGSHRNAASGDSLSDWFDIPTVSELQRSIPNHAQVLEYRVTPDTLFAWLLHRDRIFVRRIAISAKALGDTVTRFRASLGALDREDFVIRSTKHIAQTYQENLRLGRTLFKTLLEPWAAELDTAKILYLIPDGVLHLLPWGALVHEDGRFLDEVQAWVKAPSLEILTRKPKSQAIFFVRPNAGLLMVAGDLPSVASQKQTLRRMFSNFTLLQGTNATFSGVQKTLGKNRDVVYFSVRAVADVKQPLNSYMELTEENATVSGQRRKVFMRELQAWDFSLAGLVILNGCETAAGKIERGEGGMSMARFFTRAQVPHVLASLWMNDDRISANIVDDFLAGILEQRDMTKSLQQAKRNCIRRLKQKYGYPLPHFWATFELHESSFSNPTVEPND